MRALGVAVLAVLLAACHQGESISLAPTPGQRPPDIGPAATLILDVITGVGSSATVTVRVRDANGRGVGGATVQLATTAGEVEPASVVTTPDGTATAVLFSNQKATVTASIGDLRAEPISVDGQSRFRVMLGVGSTGTRGQAVAFTLRVEPLDRDLIFGAASVAFGDGTATALRIAPDALTATLSHIYYQPGAFTITGRVTDSRGLTEQASATVAIVNPPPGPEPAPPPAPSYAVSITVPTIVVAGTAAMMTASATPSNGASAATVFTWDCNADGTPESSGPAMTYGCVYSAEGPAKVSVTASGPGGAVGLGSTTVTVLAGLVPSIACTVMAAGTSTGCVATVAYAGSPLSPTTITSVAWDWGDGLTGTTTGVGANVGTHTYAVSAPYTVGATVTATTVDGAKIGTASKSISVP